MINVHLVQQYVMHYFKALRRGHGVHSPFAYKLCEEVLYNQHPFYHFEDLSNLRQLIADDETEITMEDFGAGSKVLKNPKRKIKHIAKIGISSQQQSELLYRLINFTNARNCLELGTSIGLNTLYLAKAGKQSEITTIDACSDLVKYASQLAKKNKVNNIQFIHAPFDSVLPDLLSKNKYDFIYIDGNHTYEATMRYFGWIAHSAAENCVIVLDDIFWSSGMTKAWNQIKQHQNVSLSINLFYMGIVFFKPELKQKVHLDLFI